MKRLVALALASLIAAQAMAAEMANEAEEARRISESIFGAADVDAESVDAELPTVTSDGAPADLAYGAYQRGYYLTALDRALPRAEQGDAVAQTLIAEIYANGLGVGVNLERAAGWYRLAARNGDPIAMFELANLYYNGTGVEQDRERAADLMRQAAEAGNSEAKYNLALLHVEGISVKPNLTRAADLMRQAADSELPEAQYDYGIMLLEGAGVIPDIEQGATYIRAAAEAGLQAAQVDFATMLYLGQGVERDLEAAVDWYRKAANAGNPVAQNRYAKLLAAGEGTNLSLEDAAMWRALARRQGFSDPELDRLLISIPPQMLARAEERARYWPAPIPEIDAPAFYSGMGLGNSESAGASPELEPAAGIEDDAAVSAAPIPRQRPNSLEPTGDVGQ
ncbi:hypothetical protein GCM10007989_37440 [Devosia pacifica]|uniref:Sel1 repeat family protein n=1 Tax=Devosia pacifica TaxID=1335967 RepID=A0A918SFM0_9HYPH|nr:tetratricopeptide repeat protein [Devosia pacifica]GHA38030.1 hypothetical protein GCM10007989_37440 [Devosia pacifica]